MTYTIGVEKRCENQVKFITNYEHKGTIVNTTDSKIFKNDIGVLYINLDNNKLSEHHVADILHEIDEMFDTLNRNIGQTLSIFNVEGFDNKYHKFKITRKNIVNVYHNLQKLEDIFEKAKLNDGVVEKENLVDDNNEVVSDSESDDYYTENDSD